MYDNTSLRPKPWFFFFLEFSTLLILILLSSFYIRQNERCSTCIAFHQYQRLFNNLMYQISS